MFWHLLLYGGIALLIVFVVRHFLAKRDLNRADLLLAEGKTSDAIATYEKLLEHSGWVFGDRKRDIFRLVIEHELNDENHVRARIFIKKAVEQNIVVTFGDEKATTMFENAKCEYEAEQARLAEEARQHEAEQARLAEKARQLEEERQHRLKEEREIAERERIEKRPENVARRIESELRTIDQEDAARTHEAGTKKFEPIIESLYLEGGSGYPLCNQNFYAFTFLQRGIKVWGADVTSPLPPPLCSIPYDEIVGLEIGGQGQLSSDAGIIGGGFGLSALAGMAIAGLVNAATTAHFMDTTLTITTTQGELLLRSISINPEQLRQHLSPVYVATSAMKRTKAIPTSRSPSLADELERLAKLKADGILTADDFEVAKAKLLRSQG
jgi:hypothetical protein